MRWLIFLYRLVMLAPCTLLVISGVILYFISIIVTVLPCHLIFWPGKIPDELDRDLKIIFGLKVK